MPDVIGIGLRVAGFDDLMANLEQRFLNLRHALAGFDVHVHGSGAELGPEFGIRDETARLFMRHRTLRRADRDFDEEEFPTGAYIPPSVQDVNKMTA